MIFYNLKDKSKVISTHSMEAPVEDIQWNPGENYLLVIYKDSSMKVFGEGNDKESVTFDTQGFSIVQDI